MIDERKKETRRKKIKWWVEKPPPKKSKREREQLRYWLSIIKHCIKNYFNDKLYINSNPFWIKHYFSPMTDYEQELLDDLDSSNDEQEELEQTDNPQEEEEDGDGGGDEDGSMDFNIQLQQLIESNSSNIINEFDKLDIETINWWRFN